MFVDLPNQLNIDKNINKFPFTFMIIRNLCLCRNGLEDSSLWFGYGGGQLGQQESTHIYWIPCS